MAFAALAKAGDTHIEVENAQRALTAAKDEIQELQDHYGMALKAQKVRADDLKKPTEEVGKLPAGNGGSRWIDLSVSSCQERSAVECRHQLGHDELVLVQFLARLGVQELV